MRDSRPAGKQSDMARHGREFTTLSLTVANRYTDINSKTNDKLEVCAYKFQTELISHEWNKNGWILQVDLVQATFEEVLMEEIIQEVLNKGASR